MVPPTMLDEQVSERKKENAFYFGVIAGVAIWIIAIATAGTVAYCCKKGSRRTEEAERSNY
jgi:hypothetical protein